MYLYNEIITTNIVPVTLFSDYKYGRNAFRCGIHIPLINEYKMFDYLLRLTVKVVDCNFICEKDYVISAVHGVTE